jgi:RimJ/RimL family protein N-acetyltransferase
MTQSHRFVVRRCDGFYRYWHDVTDPAPLHEAHAACTSLTRGGAYATTPANREYYDIFSADGLPGWTDGPEPLVRRLHLHDSAGIEAHLLGLDPGDRRLRFFRHSTDAQIRDYVAGIDWSSSLLLGAIQSDRIVGIAEASFDRARPSGHAEIAVSVDTALRGRGLGGHLVGRAVGYAEVLGAGRVNFSFLHRNTPFQRIVRSLGGSVDMEDLVGVIRTSRSADEPADFDQRLAA